MDNYTRLPILLLILFLLVLPLFCGFNKDEKVELTIHNPYRVTVKTKVKCDWNEEKEKYNFEEDYEVEAKKDTTIYVPDGVKKCHVYTRIKWGW